MRIVLGIDRADEGAVRWGGRAVDDASRLRFGYMPEQRGLYPRMRLRDQLVYLGRLHRLDPGEAEASVDWWLARLGVADRAADRLDKLSHGNQQRVQLAAALVHNADLLVLDEPFSGLDPIGVRAMVEVLREQVEQGATVLESAGLPPERIGALLSSPPLPVSPVEPRREDEGSRDAVFLGGLALYMALLTYGGWVGMGVLEEKSSRVVEVVLSAVRPAELLAGKVLGIGLLGLGQLALVGGVGLLSSVLAGSDAPSSAPGAVGLVLLWFVLGFAFYSCAFAVAGAAASRQEDAQASMGPLYVLLVVAYLVAQSVPSNPDGSLARISSFVPPLAPITAPSRVLLGHAPAWEVAASVALTVAATVALVRLAGRVYGGAVLRFGPRLGLRELVSPPT